MSKEDQRTPQNILEEGERILANLRRLRDSAEGPERETLSNRVMLCEKIVEDMREGVEEIRHQSAKMLGEL